jgi:CheY-like chemotaxis protein
MENNTTKFKILLVDDTPENIDILNSAFLEHTRFVALNGEKAIDTATNKQPDLILLDIMMPGMDGYETCSILKSKPKTKHIPIIFITSKTDTDSVVKGFDAGAVDYVTKPFNIGELKSRVATQLSLKKSNDDIQKYLKDIEDKNRLITDSINYAKRLQFASLPNKNYLNKILDDFFILFLPKDIVSGDFYWIKKIDNKTIIIIADCTGHGVPGAFMSMFGTAFLNEIVNRDNISTPAVILNNLRNMIIKSLNQDDTDEVQDGMDVSIISIDENNYKMEFAGAKNHIFLIRDNEITKIKADSMPVSLYPNMNPFNNNEFDIKKGDIIYLMSDGYTDQFGGEKGKKLGVKKFKEIILKNTNMKMAEQKNIFHNYFNNWKKDEEQVDDVLLFGVRI